MPLVLTLFVTAAPLGPGGYTRTVEVDGQTRTYFVHVPPKYDAESPTPVVLVLHGAKMNGPMMAFFSGLGRRADEVGFVVVYPNGSGRTGFFLAWNAGGKAGPNGPAGADDVKFVERLLDDLGEVVHIDPGRVYATGYSNGGMMCYRLATELPRTFAAIAPVAATMATTCQPRTAVPVISFHGTDDATIPFRGADVSKLKSLGLRTVSETINMWVRENHCLRRPTTTRLPDKADDGTTVKKIAYGPGTNGAEVVLFLIEGGGHAWPGRRPLVSTGGKSTMDISANDLIWEFFQQYSLQVVPF